MIVISKEDFHMWQELGHDPDQPQTLTKFKEYKVIQSDIIRVLVKDDTGKESWFIKSRFLTQEEFRNIRLNQILG
jgi:hypothetical protein